MSKMYIVQVVENMEQGLVPDAYTVDQANLGGVIGAMLDRAVFTYGLPRYIKVVAIQDGVASFELDK
jgi:hypothetical protein